MDAVISNKGLLYLGANKTKAKQIRDENPDAVLYPQISLERLSQILGFSEPNNDPLSETVKNLVKKLENLGIDPNTAVEFQDSSEKVLAEAKFFGLRGMKTVGEGFVALGDLMRKAVQAGTELEE